MCVHACACVRTRPLMVLMIAEKGANGHGSTTIKIVVDHPPCTNPKCHRQHPLMSPNHWDLLNNRGVSLHWAYKTFIGLGSMVWVCAHVRDYPFPLRE